MFSRTTGAATLDRHGIGLGLTICKMLAANFGGKIWVESQIDIGSKFHTQTQFAAQWFLPTTLLAENLAREEKVQRMVAFAQLHGYPLILKPDNGLVGKGILKVHNDTECERRVDQLNADYLLQQFTPYTFEAGVFYVRENGQSKITGINQKHFPAVVGNGCDTIQQLAERHYRFTHHWDTFLQYLDTSRVLEDGEELTLSFIGSHTMGCCFTDDRDFLTPALEEKIFAICDAQEGFNFGRLDVKAESKQALLEGDFVVIEVNGVSSLPTHMFDPRLSLLSAYRIFFEHGRYLASIAREMRDKPMQLLSLKEVLQLVRKNQGQLNRVHEALKSNS